MMKRIYEFYGHNGGVLLHLQRQRAGDGEGGVSCNNLEV